uniref:Uncharacterized protein n=1 Tax=Helianthus annuus TaxID=4232 RepID=A0A251VAM8_HELAN
MIMVRSTGGNGFLIKGRTYPCLYFEIRTWLEPRSWGINVWSKRTWGRNVWSKTTSRKTANNCSEPPWERLFL